MNLQTRKLKTRYIDHAKNYEDALQIRNLSLGYLGLGLSDLLKKNKARTVTDARKIIARFLLAKTSLKLELVANMVGLSCHSTVIQNDEVFSNILETDAEVKSIYDRIEDVINQTINKTNE